jgi:membrane protease subunit HflK
MAWNEPGGNKHGKDKDPWNKHSGPPDLEQAIRNLQHKFSALFGGGRNRKSNSSGGSGNLPGALGLGFVAFIVLLVYGLSGIYIVQPAEKAVVTRLGQYLRTEGPGPHWVPRFIEDTQIVNVMQVMTTLHEGQMLTMDENIVNAEIAVQYRIKNPRNYLFNVIDPEESLKKVAESALRGVVGQSTLDQVLTSGRADIALRIRNQIKVTLEKYHSGLEIADMALQTTKPPSQVQDAFDDAIKAQQDEERFVNQAEAYAMQKVPIAEGRAQRIIEEANAYQQQVTLIAQGDAIKFTQLLPEYQYNPQVMRDRMYLDTLQSIFSATTKVLIDVKEVNNLLYLPLEQLFKSQSLASKSAEGQEEESDRDEQNSNSGARSPSQAFRPSYPVGSLRGGA